MDKAPAHLTPPIGVLPTDDDDVGRHAQVPQGAMKTNRLLSLVGDLRLDHKEVDIAVGIGFPPGVRTEQDHLGVRGSRGQAAASLGNQGLVNYLHGPKS
jgi:hypothetical protein